MIILHQSPTFQITEMFGSALKEWILLISFDFFVGCICKFEKTMYLSIHLLYIYIHPREKKHVDTH